MKKIFCILLLFVSCISIFYCSNGQSTPATTVQKIVIIRHGEKPDEGDNLSCQGFNRALALPAVLYKKFGTSEGIYVPSINTGKSTSTARMYQTILPFAIKYNLPINSKFNVEDVNGLAVSLLKKGGSALVIWEHKNIDNLAKALGVSSSPKWGADDFDSIWIITVRDGKATLSMDKESLQPAASCQ